MLKGQFVVFLEDGKILPAAFDHCPGFNMVLSDSLYFACPIITPSPASLLHHRSTWVGFYHHHILAYLQNIRDDKTNLRTRHLVS